MSDYPNTGFRANPQLDDDMTPAAPQGSQPAADAVGCTNMDDTVSYSMPEESNTPRMEMDADVVSVQRRPSPHRSQPEDMNAGSVRFDQETGRQVIGRYPASEGREAGCQATDRYQASEGWEAGRQATDRYQASEGWETGRQATDRYSASRSRGSETGSFRNPPPYPPIDNDYPGGKGSDQGGKKTGKKKEDSFGKRILKTIAVALVFGLAAGAAFSGVNHIIGGGQETTKSEETRPSGEDSKSGSASGSDQQQTQVSAAAVDYTQVVEDVMPSVVAITGTFTQEGWFGQTYSGEGAGSGFITEITDDEILIGTNNHVVDGGTNITVLFIDETSVPATVVGTDKDADLAVLSVKRSDVKEETIKAIKTVVFSEEEVKVGQSVIAIGNALGYGQSVTTGVISAKNRRVSFTDGSMTLLQTDAAINPGNSGGILINTSGQVVGINNAKLEDTSVEGMCYAIPVSRAVPILEDLKTAGTINEDEQGYLGIYGQTVDTSYTELYDIPAGVVVTSVIENSPARQAGLQEGDVIVSFDGNEISTMEGLQSRISHKKAGEKVAMTIKRKEGDTYKDQEVTVTMGKKSDMPQTSQNDQNNQPDTQDPNAGGGQDDQYNWEDILPYIFGN